MLTIRPLTTLAECRQVVALEREIWGYTTDEDVVPSPVLIVSIKRGGILLGAFDNSGEMKGFVYSLPALKDGRPAQWSHMLGVTADSRGSGLGARLKLAQRDQALAMGLDLIEWTYDPLQAANAHLNLAKLGAVASTYEVNIYGDSSSPLHRGTPTDRLIAEWHIASPHVARRLTSWGQPVVRDGSIAAAPVVNPSIASPRWSRPGTADLDAGTRQVLIEIPVGFADMQQEDPELALAWRLHTRDLFHTYFGRGYRAVDFLLSQRAPKGHYLLARVEN